MMPCVIAADPHHLQRFIDGQDGLFEAALREIGAGSKQTHWMWFIFPQLAGLGRSPTAQFYAIRSLSEANAYLAHPLLGYRLRQSVEAILAWSGRRTAEQILGAIDAIKLRSSLTLFDQVAPGDIFARGLAVFFAGRSDAHTLALLNAQA
jgi:uncharacterized protein (DUF1810 family)